MATRMRDGPYACEKERMSVRFGDLNLDFLDDLSWWSDDRYAKKKLRRGEV